MSSKNRKANHYEWFQTQSQQFYRLGRYLLRRRKEYAQFVVSALSEWMRFPAMREVDDRARMVHGLAYAGFDAACKVFKADIDLVKYFEWLIPQTKTSAAEVQESVSVDLFWREVLTANESDAFGEYPEERRRVWHVIEERGAVSPVSELQTKHGAEHQYTQWRSYKLYFQPGPVIEMLRIFKRKSGRDVAIQQNDLRNQMKVQGYWVEADSKYGHRQKFNGVTKSCWCIAVDRHELGLNPRTDAEFEASLLNPSQQETFLPRDDWSDPRKGDLFGLIESLFKKKTSDDKKDS